MSESESRAEKHRIKKLRTLKRLKTLPRNEGRRAERENDVVVQPRPVAQPQADVDADVARDVVVLEDLLQGLCVRELQVAGVDDRGELRRQLHVRAEVVEKQPGVDEVGLALLL